MSLEADAAPNKASLKVLPKRMPPHVKVETNRALSSKEKVHMYMHMYSMNSNYCLTVFILFILHAYVEIQI